MTNKYSFFNVKKSDIFDLYDILIDSDITNKTVENTNITNEVVEDADITNETVEDIDDEKISLFILENELIMQEYCFQTGETRLFRDNGDDTLAILYECQKEENSYIITIYTPDGAYNVVSNIDDKVNFASYMQAEAFINLYNLINKNSIAPLKAINQIKINSYATYNSFPFIENGNIIDYNEYNYFKNLYTRYSTATKYIPASNMINTILEQINHYIATR